MNKETFLSLYYLYGKNQINDYLYWNNVRAVLTTKKGTQVGRVLNLYTHRCGCIVLKFIGNTMESFDLIACNYQGREDHFYARIEEIHLL